MRPIEQELRDRGEADILRVAKKYLHPEALTIMVVGDETKFDQPLSVFGEVKEIKLENAK